MPQIELPITDRQKRDDPLWVLYIGENTNLVFQVRTAREKADTVVVECYADYIGETKERIAPALGTETSVLSQFSGVNVGATQQAEMPLGALVEVSNTVLAGSGIEYAVLTFKKRENDGTDFAV